MDRKTQECSFQELEIPKVLGVGEDGFSAF